ncbi:MAG TPA: response regulator [Vicinamibacterales bacterium]|nr:response regulator [Vicinamibacterales bacterium]
MTSRGVVFVVDDDASVRRGLVRLLSSAGFDARPFDSAPAFGAAPRDDAPSCLLLDQRMPEQTGLQLQQALAGDAAILPIIFLTGHADVPLSVQAMKAGAFDFLTKPVDEGQLIDAVTRALDVSRSARAVRIERDGFLSRLDALTAREREVCALVVRGLLNKQIAAELGIAEKTVKIHRARVMQKLGVGSVAELSRLIERTHASLRP